MSDKPNPDWVPDQDDEDSVDDLVARNVSLLRIERMDDDSYWMMFEIDGVQHNIDFSVRPGCRKEKRTRRLRAFNRGDLAKVSP